MGIEDVLCELCDVVPQPVPEASSVNDDQVSDKSHRGCETPPLPSSSPSIHMSNHPPSGADEIGVVGEITQIWWDSHTRQRALGGGSHEGGWALEGVTDEGGVAGKVVLI